MAFVIFNSRKEDGTHRVESTPPDVASLDEYKKFIMFVNQIEEDTGAFGIRSLGYEKYTPGKVVHRAHQVYSIRYVVGGHGTFNGKPVTRGNAYLSVPGLEYHIVGDDANPMEQFWIELWGVEAPNLVHQMLGALEPGVYTYQFADVLKEIYANVFFNADGRIDHKTDMMTVLFKLIAYHTKENEKQAPILTHSARLFYDATKLIEAHYSENITVNSICERLHIVPDYLYKIFRQYAGVSTQAYLMNYRMSIASGLLSKSDLSVGAVGTRVGYPDQSQFSRVFHKFSGKTPQAYRKAMLLTPQ